MGGASSTTQSFVCSTLPGVTSKSSSRTQGEAGLAAHGVRGRVVDPRVGVHGQRLAVRHVPMSSIATTAAGAMPRPRYSSSTDQPASSAGSPPCRDASSRRCRRPRGARDRDAELRAGALAPQAQVALVPGDHLLVALDAAQLVHELMRVRAPQQVEVVGRPRVEFDVGHAPIEPPTPDAPGLTTGLVDATRSRRASRARRRAPGRAATSAATTDSDDTRPRWACVRRSVRSCCAELVEHDVRLVHGAVGLDVRVGRGAADVVAELADASPRASPRGRRSRARHAASASRR